MDDAKVRTLSLFCSSCVVAEDVLESFPFTAFIHGAPPNYCSTADDRLTRILSLRPAERQSTISQQVQVVGLKVIRTSAMHTRRYTAGARCETRATVAVPHNAACR